MCRMMTISWKNVNIPRKLSWMCNDFEQMLQCFTLALIYDISHSTQINVFLYKFLWRSIWDKILKNGSSKTCGRQHLRNLNHFKFFKGCLLQILLGPFSNTLSHFIIVETLIVKYFPLKSFKYFESVLICTLFVFFDIK